MHFFSPNPGKEVVRWCDHCDEVFPCGDCCWEGVCGYAECITEENNIKECWCINAFNYKVNNCPIHGVEYFYDERQRVKNIFNERILEKRKNDKPKIS